MKTETVFGLRRQVKRHAAFDLTKRMDQSTRPARPKAVSPLRSATALQKFAVLVLCVLAVLPLASRAAATNDLAATLRNGLFEEQVNHNLDAAIETYQSLVTQFDKDRPLAATAAFRLGECYRTLNKTNEAAAQYQRVVKDFPDQTTLVTLSRQNLAAIFPGVTSTDSPDQTVAESYEITVAAGDTLASIAKSLLRDPTKPIPGGAIQAILAANPGLDGKRLRVGQKILIPAADFKAPLTDEEDQEIRRIQAMIQNSPDLINASSGQDLGTPLIHAASKDQLQVARFLLKHGADVNARGENRVTALHAAAQTGHKTMVELLLNNGAEIDAKREYKGSYAGDYPKCSTALDLAAKKNFPAVVDVLLEHKADPNIKGDDQMSPLHRAAENSSKSIVEMLLAHGADVNAKNAIGETPLHLAASKGNAEIVSLLLTNKADVAAPTTSGDTPLHYGANYPKVIKLLVASGVEVNARNNSGETPLRSAGNADAANMLLKAGANPDIAASSGGREGWTPLHYAAENENTEVAEALLQHGANPNAATIVSYSNIYPPGTTPLSITIYKKNQAMTRMFLKFKANPNLPVNGMSPLDLAISWQKNAALAEILLQGGADVNQESRKRTPLQLAVETRSKALVETVLAHSPDVNVISSAGNTALDFTRGIPEAGMTEIAELLRAHGALDNVPRFDRIQVSRPSANFLATVFRKGTNDWNRFTLMETILNAYSMNLSGSSLPRGGVGFQTAASSPLSFPDLSHIVIARHNRANTNETRLPVNLFNTTNGVDCSKDMVLEFGDVVEIPEREHALSESAVGLTDAQQAAMVNCRKGKVHLVVRGQETELEIYPYISSYVGATLFNNDKARKALLSSSDLSLVKVIRRDSQTGKKQEWILDCSNQQSSPDFWLRDGDVIAVPEK